MDQPLPAKPRLWTPNQVFWIGFAFGWPGAVAMACANWARAGRGRKAAIHIGLGLAALVAYSLLAFHLNGKNLLLPLLINLLILYYLRDNLMRDLPPKGSYPSPGVLRGAALCLAILFVYLAALFAFLFVATFFDILQGHPPVFLLPGAPPCG